MEKTKLTLLVDAKLLEAYKRHCQKEGLIISRQVEKLMEKHTQKSD
jgi:hypothetical protein